MELEEYLELDNPNGIRIKGTRINLEVVVRATQEGLTPDQIAQDYSPLTLEQLHAVLAYYHRNRDSVDEYMRRQESEYKKAKRKHEQGERPEVVQRLLRLQADLEGKVST